MVSADTAMPHLADAYHVPCLTFFTTHRPEWRVRDYPNVRAVHLPVQGLPGALEFARDTGDEAAARLAWFQRGSDLAWVAQEVTRFTVSACRTRPRAGVGPETRTRRVAAPARA